MGHAGLSFACSGPKLGIATPSYLSAYAFELKRFSGQWQDCQMDFRLQPWLPSILDLFPVETSWSRASPQLNTSVYIVLQIPTKVR